MSTTRDQIIATTCELLESQGYRATGLNQIIRQSGAPRGSLYYYFPEGKNQLTAEAIRRIGAVVEERIRASLASEPDPGEAVRQFLGVIAGCLEASGYRAGGPLTTVALETASTNERLREVCAEVYGRWQAAFAAKLIAGGCAPERAARLATMIIATIEGATVLSRTRHSVEPMHLAADELRRLITASI